MRAVILIIALIGSVYANDPPGPPFYTKENPPEKLHARVDEYHEFEVVSDKLWDDRHWQWNKPPNRDTINFVKMLEYILPLYERALSIRLAVKEGSNIVRP